VQSFYRCPLTREKKKCRVQAWRRGREGRKNLPLRKKGEDATPTLLNNRNSGESFATDCRGGKGKKKGELQLMLTDQKEEEALSLRNLVPAHEEERNGGCVHKGKGKRIFGRRSQPPGRGKRTAGFRRDVWLRKKESNRSDRWGKRKRREKGGRIDFLLTPRGRGRRPTGKNRWRTVPEKREKKKETPKDNHGKRKMRRPWGRRKAFLGEKKGKGKKNKRGGPGRRRLSPMRKKKKGLRGVND